MLELTTYTELEIAHRLVTSYAQKCRHLHGHRYEVEITVTSKHRSLNKDGMIVDFKKLKEIVKGVLDEVWDHGACFNAADPLAPTLMADYETTRLHIVDANPTLEWMVGTWAHDLQTAFDTAQLDLTLERLKASETAKNTVTWTRDCGSEPAVDPDKPKKTWANVPIPSARDARVERTKMEVDAAALKQASREESRARHEMIRNLSVKTGVGIGTCRKVLMECDWDFAHAHKKLEYLRHEGILGCQLAPADECQLKEMPKDTCRDGRSNQQKIADLMERTGYPEDVCLKALIDGGWDFALAEKNLAYEYDHGRTPGYYKQKAAAIAPASPVMEKAEQEITRPEVAVEVTKPEDELREDEEAYLVSYWPVGYPQPVSAVFATAMRGIALVRTLKAAVEARHPNGVTLIGFNRVPR